MVTLSKRMDDTGTELSGFSPKPLGWIKGMIAETDAVFTY